MTRKKVTLAYITNDAARKATFKKRKKGLMKKVNELSTLCGIESCAIIYSPYDAEPEVWPSMLGAKRTIARFRNMSEMDQSKRMMNQAAFIKQRIAKAHEHLKKQLRENREKEMSRVMYRALSGHGLHGLSLLDLNDLGWVVDKNLREIDEKIRSLKKNPSPKESVIEVAAFEGKNKAKVEVGEASNGAAGSLALDNSQDQQPWHIYMELLKSNENGGNFERSNEAALPYYVPNQSQLSWSNNNFHFP